MTPLIDPRAGDVEDDASSTKRRSLLAIAGSLLSEISLPKLALAWGLLVVLPVVLLGVAPLVASGWVTTLSRSMQTALAGVVPLVLLVGVIGLGWFAGRTLFRMAERSFWSLNSLTVQPVYAAWREGLRHLAEFCLSSAATPQLRSGLRAGTAACAGLIMSGFAILAIVLAWPHTRWVGAVTDLASPLALVVPAIANSTVLLGAYLAVASIAWGIADATMPQPKDLATFDTAPAGARLWRVVHLSDLHIVGERFGFRIESGRSGPRGNDRLDRVFTRLAEIHAKAPLDLVLVTGDVTDAGRSAEWAEFLTTLERFPQLRARMLLLPGNHDLNVVDRANPARLDLPTSPSKRLRQMRALSTIAAVQGDAVAVGKPANASRPAPHATLTAMLAPHATAMASFADEGRMRLSAGLAEAWVDAFPMVRAPESEDGLGVVMLNSNAETHFSFTNALGIMPAEQAHKLLAVLRAFPRARWIIALHHHMVEYPSPASAFSERIGTALINGSWFVRQLLPFADRIVVMHGHRHIDWIGECGGLRIISAPSPVMESTDEHPSYCYIHSLAAGENNRLALLQPEQVDVPGALPA